MKRREKWCLLFLLPLVPPAVLRFQKREPEPLIRFELTSRTSPLRSFVSSIAYSPNGQTLACAFATERARKMINGDFCYWTPAEVRLYNPQNGALQSTIRLGSGAVNQLAFSPDGKTMRGNCEDGFTRWWDVATGRVIHRVWQGKLWLLASSADGRWQIAQRGPKPKSPPYNHTILLRDNNTGKVQHELNVGERPATAAAFSPDRQKVVLVGDRPSDYEIIAKWYRTSDFKLLRTENWGKAEVSWLGFAPDSQIVGVSWGPFLRLGSGQIGILNRFSDDYSKCGALSSDGQWLTVGGYFINPPWQSKFDIDYRAEQDTGARFGQAGIWDVKTRKQLRQIRTGQGVVTEVALAPDNSQLAMIVSSTLYDNQRGHVEVWPLNTNAP